MKELFRSKVLEFLEDLDISNEPIASDEFDEGLMDKKCRNEITDTTLKELISSVTVGTIRKLNLRYTDITDNGLKDFFNSDYSKRL